MKQIRTASELTNFVFKCKENKLKIGFVPTMGALHNGHISLVETAKKWCDIVIVSIFVNPKQFNNPSDLEKYPRTEEADCELLKKNYCDVVYLPSVLDVYPENYTPNKVNLGFLEQTMEGEFRPGHFDGVVQVVSRLFEIVQPDTAFFGLKDFQQVAVIRFMTEKLNFPIEIIACETLREKSGLAMSSRNMRLSDEQKEEALIIYETLQFCKENKNNFTPKELQQKAIELFNKSNLRLEYLKIVNGNTLAVLNDIYSKNAVVCIAAYAGDVRLIDNIRL